MSQLTRPDTRAIDQLVHRFTEHWQVKGRFPKLKKSELLLLNNPQVIPYLVQKLLITGVGSETEQKARLKLLGESLWQYHLCLNEGMPPVRPDPLAQTEQLLLSHAERSDQGDWECIREVINVTFAAGFEISEALLDALNFAEYSDEEAEVGPEGIMEIAANMDQMAAEMPDLSSYDMATMFFEQLNQLPGDAAPLFCVAMLQASHPKVNDIALLLLTHPLAKVRQSLLAHLPELAEQDLFKVRDLQRLVLLRNWLPENEQQPLDQCIRSLQRQQRGQLTQEYNPQAQIQTIQITPADTGGALALQIELKENKQYRMFGCVLKIGTGIKDAFLSEPVNRKTVRARMNELSELMPVRAISEAQLAALLEHFLLLNRPQGSIPMPLLALTEMTEGDWRHPHPLSEQRVARFIATGCKDKEPLTLTDFVNGWALAESPHTDMLSFIKAEIAPHKEVWYQRLLVCACAFATSLDEAEELLNAAVAVREGSPLSEIPLFRAIAFTSIGVRILPTGEPAPQSPSSPPNIVDLFNLFDDEADDDDDDIDYSHLFEREPFKPGPRPKRAVYQLKVQLKGSKPPIWRQLRVMNTIKLSQLHDILQLALGWEDYHLYEFRQQDLCFIADLGEETEFFDDAYFSHEAQVRDLLQRSKDKMIYTYDFGDHWEHSITLEEVIPAGRRNTPAELIKAKGACPPEDCGGLYGFKNVLAVLADPTHEEHQELLEWLGPDKTKELIHNRVEIEAINAELSDM